ncbi:MAG: SDR family NAD(P)-dependent oxidoreductase, partial [Terriglobus roseus]|nr:SDR family NAD(P)-dependent oxidoreductase [Terriglobus roseus]
AKAEIEASGISGKLSTLQLDVTDESSVKQAAEKVKTEFGRLDALVNNAGIANGDKNPLTRFRACMETNVTGPVLVAQAFTPLLLKASNAYSIYVSSGLGSLTLATGPERAKLMPVEIVEADAYRASKAALNMVTVLDWDRYNEKGLKVFAMCPGFVRSNLRGTDEAAVSGWGGAGDPKVSGALVRDIIAGKRDADVGKFVKTDGVWPW